MIASPLLPPSPTPPPLSVPPPPALLSPAWAPPWPLAGHSPLAWPLFTGTIHLGTTVIFLKAAPEPQLLGPYAQGNNILVKPHLQPPAQSSGHAGPPWASGEPLID